MNPRLTRFITIAIICCAGFSLFGMQWPLKDGKLILSSTFGESRVTHFHDGLDLSATNVPVYPLEPGEILYYRFFQENPYQPIMGPGNYVLVDHKKGAISSYYHLSSRIPSWESAAVDEDSVLGFVANTGHSAGPHLHFNMTRNNGRKSFNILRELPTLEDDNPPKIEALFLYQTRKKEWVHIAQNDQFPISQNYPLAVAIRDAGKQKNTRRGIYKLKVKHNGRQLMERTFDAIEFTNGKWKLNGTTPLKSVFMRKYYYLEGLDLSNGENHIEIECEDLGGNKTSKSFLFKVFKS